MVSVSCYLLIYAYFKTAIIFVFQALKVLETGELLLLFCVEVFGVSQDFLFCVLLYLLILNQEKMPP